MSENKFFEQPKDGVFSDMGIISNQSKKCMGLTCESTDGTNHSIACLCEHTVACHGITEKMGNKFAYYRYKGYKGEYIDVDIESPEHQKAYLEGVQAQERLSY